MKFKAYILTGLLMFAILMLAFGTAFSVLYFGVTLICNWSFRWQVPIGFALIMTVLWGVIDFNDISDAAKKAYEMALEKKKSKQS